MATDNIHTSLQNSGYRRTILVIGVLWGAVPALSYGFSGLGPVSTEGVMLIIGVLMTISLGVLYELDSQKLSQHGKDVPLAWSYALIAPLSFLLLPPFGAVGIFFGPPLSALVYVWQRGRHL